MNKLATIAAYFTLWSHTLAIGIGLYIEQKIVLPLIIGLSFMIVAFIESFFIEWKCSKPEIHENKCSDVKCRHIVWGFPHRYYTYVFAVCISLCLVYIRPFWLAITVSGLFISSFIVSLLYARNAAGSYWCWIAAVFSFLFIFLNAHGEKK